MRTFRQIVGLLTFLFLAGQARSQSVAPCLDYEPTVVKLEGTIVSRTYPGPPEYESIRRGDEPETYWLLALSAPVCMNEDKPNFNPAYTNVRKIQLVFPDEKAYKEYRKLLGKRLVATGTLYAGFNAHHKTRVLLIVHNLMKPN